ncbi:MAG TPA: hypothetical protein VGU21_06670 [Streptosporangiaceae bacterium]|nr:hypothetical protein [Streptosporangiaceae bacterium]
MLLLSALVAMALGAGVTLAFTQPDHGIARPAQATASTATPQLAAAARQQASAWITREVASDITVGCDPVMCNELQRSGLPVTRLLPLQPSAPDPLGAQLVVATPVIRNQFGTRLATVYAPLVIASFGSGVERVDVRYIAPDGSKAFEAQLATYRKNRITAGRQLLDNNHIQASAAARGALLAGQVDPRLLVTLSTLAGLMPLHLIAFVDPSPGASADVPLRGAEIGAAVSAGLPAMVAFMRAQQGEYAPAVARITQDAGGRPVFIVRYDAPGPMELDGS